MYIFRQHCLLEEILITNIDNIINNNRISFMQKLYTPKQSKAFYFREKL